MGCFPSTFSSTVLPSAISGRYLIGAHGALPPHAPADIVRSDVAVANVLRRCLESRHDIRTLRAHVDDVHRSGRSSALSDAAVIELTVRLVCSGRLKLLTTEPLAAVKGVPMEMPLPPAARPAPTSSAPTRRTESTVPSFSADVDAAALVGVLLAASKDGTPFCEECARAARAA